MTDLTEQLTKNEGVEINAELKAKNEKLRTTISFVRNENVKRNNDCKILAQTLLKVSPEHKAWLEKNYKEYL